MTDAPLLAADEIVLERALSKTQLEAWKSCQRKWGWSYLAGIRGEENKFASFGTKVHSQLERWLRDGIVPDQMLPEGKVATAGLHLLPAPQTEGLLVEAEIFTITQQAIYHGFGDIIEPPRIVGTAVAPTPIITDHKSTVDFKWALTEEGLETDIQANIYARAAMQLYDTPQSVAQWLYYRTRGAPKAHPVSRVMHRDRVEQVFAEIIDPIAAEIQAARELDIEMQRAGKRLPVLELTPNTRSCSDYGGCPFRGDCNISSRERLRAKMAHETLAERMKRQAEETRQKRAAEAAGGGAATAPAAAQEEPNPGAVNPPETAKLPSLKERMAALKNGTATAPATAPAAAPTSAPEAAAEPAPASAPKAPKAGAKAATKAVAPSGGFVLLVGCFPIKGGDAVHATDWIGPAKVMIESELGLVDYRLADFGKGPGMLAAAVRQVLSDQPPPSGSLVFLDMRTDEGRHCYDSFRENASLIVRAF